MSEILFAEDDADIRKSLRALITRQGQLVSRAATEDDSVYRLYYDCKFFSCDINTKIGVLCPYCVI